MTTKKIEIPGAPAIEYGTVGLEAQEIIARLEAIHAQFGEVVNALNIVNGQLDMQIRLTVGASLKSTIKQRFIENDKRVKAAKEAAAQAVAQQSNSSEEGDVNEG